MSTETETKPEAPAEKKEKRSVFPTAAEAIAETNTRNANLKPKNGKKPSNYKTYKVTHGDETRFIVSRSQGGSAGLAAVEFGIGIELIGGKSLPDPATYLSLLSEEGTEELAELIAARKK